MSNDPGPIVRDVTMKEGGSATALLERIRALEEDVEKLKLKIQTLERQEAERDRDSSGDTSEGN